MTVSVTARRLTAAALTAAALTAVAGVPASAADHRAHRPSVEITRVQYNAPGFDSRSNRSVNSEWVEITNRTRSSVNLDGWTLTAERGHVTYTFHHFRLDGRSTVRVHTGVGHDTRRDVYQDRRRHVWDNRSDTATLRNDHRRVVDTESWGGRHR